MALTQPLFAPLSSNVTLFLSLSSAFQTCSPDIEFIVWFTGSALNPGAKNMQLPQTRNSPRVFGFTFPQTSLTHLPNPANFLCKPAMAAVLTRFQAQTMPTRHLGLFSPIDFIIANSS
jgi:hypothetical protein